MARAVVESLKNVHRVFTHSEVPRRASSEKRGAPNGFAWPKKCNFQEGPRKRES